MMVYHIIGGMGGIGSALDGLHVPHCSCDVVDRGSLDRFFAGLVGEVQIVNAAAVCINGSLRKMEDASLDIQIGTNLIGATMLTAAFSRHAATGSSLLHLSSVVGEEGMPGAVAYGASKAGLRGLVRGAAKEIAPRGLRVNAIEMGYFDVGMIRLAPPDIVTKIPLGRLGAVAELDAMCKAILSNTYMTGAVVRLAGGL